MSDTRSAVLVELAADVFAPLPCEAVAHGVDEPAPANAVVIERRDGDRFLVRWCNGAPAVDGKVELQLVRGAAVFMLSAHVAEIVSESSGLLSVVELRRRKQRRTAPRARCDELILVSSDERDADAELVDVSAAGFSFQHTRPLESAAQIGAVLNLRGVVIPCQAVVRRVGRVGESCYQIGCSYARISDEHRRLVANYASANPIDRRTEDGATPLRDRLARG